jgi:hypothetical protein
MKYYGNWNTNNGNTFNGVPFRSNNLRKLRKDLRERIAGNLTDPRDLGRWSIYDNGGNLVISGTCKW